MLTTRHVAHGSGLSWLAGGWSCFRGRWQPLAVLSAGLYLLMVLLGQSGAILLPILATFYLAIVASYRRMAQRGEVFLAGSGVLRNASLWALAAVSLAVAGVVAAAMVWGLLKGAPGGGHPDKGLFYWLGLAQLSMMLLLSTFWLAPALIVQRGIGVFQALRLSAAGSLRNPLPFLTMLAVGALVTMLSMFVLGLGLVVALPVLACAAAQAAEDIVA